MNQCQRKYTQSIYDVPHVTVDKYRDQNDYNNNIRKSNDQLNQKPFNNQWRTKESTMMFLM